MLFNEENIHIKQKMGEIQMKKRMAVLLVLGCVGVLAGCGEISDKDVKELSDTTKDVVKEVADQTANIRDSEEEHVLSVKGGHPESYPNATYGKAFEDFFAYPTWKYFKGTKEGSDEDGDGKPDTEEENVDIVEFTGYCTYQDVEVKALIQFTLNDDNTFTATYLSYNDVPQNNLMLWGLLEKVFEDYEGETEVKTAQNEETSANEDELLEEFIDLLCSYSDPPDCEGEELQAYFENEYEQWKENSQDSRIYMGDDGHLKLKEDVSELTGTWGDTYSQRAHMTIKEVSGKLYVQIEWSSGAADNTKWIFSSSDIANLGNDNIKISYEDCKEVDEHYNEDGTCTETVVSSGGSGYMYYDGKIMTWNDNNFSTSTNCTFTRTQDAAGNSVASKEYIIEDSNFRELTEADLYHLTAEQCRIARNEIYARHGRMFQDAALQQHFESCSWYTGMYSASEFSDDMLSDVERKNLQTISAYETKMGYK